MKNFYTLLFSLLISFTVTSQVVTNYNSKWFLGFNTGATWSCTDVDDSWMWRNNENYLGPETKYESPWGWGLTLGKSFNYDYGNIFSFDLRGRYLRGRWYGQNSMMDSISMDDFDPTINVNDASAHQLAQLYQNNYGGYYHNYEADIHRIALELVLHFNRFREKTRIDPYIFGGVGLTFKKSMGDFLDVNGNLYDETTLMNHNLDLDYETQLNPNENLVHFMPSAGFGIGYQIAPRVSLGLEHKTTFTLKDQFDGVISETPRLKNDWYHYTSGYIRFRLGGGNGSSGSSSNQSSSNYSTNPNSNGFTSNCPGPNVSIYNTQNQTVSNRTIQISAKITNVSNVNEIKLMDGNRMLLPFDFDSYSNMLSAVVNLNSGSNTFYIKANNNCGSDMEQLNITYADCLPPDGYFISPSQNETNLELSNYQIKAHLNNIKNASMIKLYINNVQVYGFSFDVNTGTFESDLTLSYGSNNIRIEYENPCGGGTIETNINYIECSSPTIELLNPTASGSTTNDRIYQIRARIEGTEDENDINTRLNGALLNKSDKQDWKLDINPVDYSILTFNVNLINGINTISIEVNNDCGSETITFTLDLENCNAPEINIMSPITGNTFQNSTVDLAAQILNVSNATNITYQLNGQVLQGINYNSANQTSSGKINLSPGDNYITISASNDCGSDVETTHIIFDECKTPVINVLSSNIEVTNSNFTFQASVGNMPSQNGLSLVLNGQNINYSY
ncbi:MAG: hypothetical protein VX280_03865, partial [Bacteroidota bacterium]|nr:hypothetical protein [Bacteroidota bacterium]